MRIYNGGIRALTHAAILWAYSSTCVNRVAAPYNGVRKEFVLINACVFDVYGVVTAMGGKSMAIAQSARHEKERFCIDMRLLLR